MDILFYDSDSKMYTVQDIIQGLHEIGADDCETLFIHSDIMFGKPAEGFKKKEYLQVLYEIISGLGVSSIIVPTFSYSFPNNEDYNILGSRTSMGAFNEFIRKQPNRYRTDDPILSVSVPSSLTNKFDHVSNHSLGEGGALDIIHHMDGVKFLFFGAEMADCFTYVHYVEKMMDVPYRFDMPFTGNVIYPDGKVQQREQIIHTQCTGAVLPPKYSYFEEEMETKGFLKKKRIGDKYIAAISEADAYQEIEKHITENVNYFLAKPFDEKKLIHEYTYSTENGRITHC